MLMYLVLVRIARKAPMGVGMPNWEMNGMAMNQQILKLLIMK